MRGIGRARGARCAAMERIRRGTLQSPVPFLRHAPIIVIFCLCNFFAFRVIFL